MFQQCYDMMKKDRDDRQSSVRKMMNERVQLVKIERFMIVKGRYVVTDTYVPGLLNYIEHSGLASLKYYYVIYNYDCKILASIHMNAYQANDRCTSFTVKHTCIFNDTNSVVSMWEKDINNLVGDEIWDIAEPPKSCSMTYRYPNICRFVDVFDEEKYMMSRIELLYPTNWFENYRRSLAHTLEKITEEYPITCEKYPDYLFGRLYMTHRIPPTNISTDDKSFFLDSEKLSVSGYDLYDETIRELNSNFLSVCLDGKLRKL